MFLSEILGEDLGAKGRSSSFDWEQQDDTLLKRIYLLLGGLQAKKTWFFQVSSQNIRPRVLALTLQMSCIISLIRKTETL